MISALKKIDQKRAAIILILLSLVFLLSFNTTYAFVDLVFDALASVIFNICIAIGGMFLVLGSAMLDLAIFQLIVKMGTWFDGQQAFGLVVNTGWTMVRDILNMFFIFGLIYLGIKTILNSNDSNTRRSLGNLIIAALLINFSLLFTQIIVDFSNNLATQVYNQIIQNATSSVGESTEGNFRTPIAEMYLASVGFSSWFSDGSIELVRAGDALGTVLFALMLMMFFIIAGGMFFLGGIMIVTRFVALILYMIFSPIMFLGLIWPSFKAYQDRWWNGFLKYTFFAPLYLMLTYLSVRFMQNIFKSGVSVQKDFGSGFTGQEISMSFGLMVLYFMIMIGLLYASLKVGDKLSIAGSKIAINTVHGAGKSVRGMAYRGTVGLGAAGLVWGYDSLDKRAESEKGTRGRRLASVTRRFMGGEAGRKAVTGIRDKSVGGYGRAEEEKMKAERTARAIRGNTITDFKANTKDYLSGKVLEDGRKLNISDSQLLEVMEKDPKKRQEILENYPHLVPPSVYKSIVEDEKGRFNDADKGKASSAKRDIKNKIAASEDSVQAAKDYVKRVKSDAKEVAELLDSDNIAANDHVLEAIKNNPALVANLGQYVPDSIRADVKKSLSQKSDGNLDKTFQKSHFW